MASHLAVVQARLPFVVSRSNHKQVNVLFQKLRFREQMDSLSSLRRWPEPSGVISLIGNGQHAEGRNWIPAFAGMTEPRYFGREIFGREIFTSSQNGRLDVAGTELRH